MIIRRAIAQDSKSLNWLLTLLIRDEKKYDENIDENFVVTNMYENYIEDRNRYIVVAEENNTIIGYLYGYIKQDVTGNNKVCMLDALYVVKEYRQKKIASKLIHSFQEWCVQNQVMTIDVNVCSENIIAKKLYSDNHFITTSETMTLKIK
jgi:GNAT superfamily N-acetyltransferase